MAARPPKDLTVEDRRLWDRIARSVQPAKKRKSLRVIAEAPSAEASVAVTAPKPPPRFVRPPVPSSMPATAPPSGAIRSASAPDVLEPRRQRRLSRERDPIEARIDLHGFGRFEAEDQLAGFLLGAHARDLRAVLVITGHGKREGGRGGIIRASVHEWLQSPRLRGVVSGFASAHRRHGGDGAIYVTLKRRS